MLRNNGGVLPLPLGEGWREGLSVSSLAPSPNPSQREGKKPRAFPPLDQNGPKVCATYWQSLASLKPAFSASSLSLNLIRFASLTLLKAEQSDG